MSTLFSSARAAAVATICAASLSSNAHATIIAAPSSIVDHGSYITDLVNHRDWYKFSNVASTNGESFEDALAQFGTQGWAGAAIADVQLLEAQFGWVSDTPSYSANANFGLTQAMAGYLGYTAHYSFEDGPVSDAYDDINAVTSDLVFFGTQGTHLVSQSSTETFVDARGNTIFFGDSVDGFHDTLSFGESNEIYGVWLTRESAAVIPAVPEPSEWAMLGFGLIGLSVRSRVIRNRSYSAAPGTIQDCGLGRLV